jgi:hypothetical protein
MKRSRLAVLVWVLGCADEVRALAVVSELARGASLVPVGLTGSDVAVLSVRLHEVLALLWEVLLGVSIYPQLLRWRRVASSLECTSAELHLELAWRWLILAMRWLILTLRLLSGRHSGAHAGGVRASANWLECRGRWKRSWHWLPSPLGWSHLLWCVFLPLVWLGLRYLPLFARCRA